MLLTLGEAQHLDRVFRQVERVQRGERIERLRYRAEPVAPQGELVERPHPAEHALVQLGQLSVRQVEMLQVDELGEGARRTARQPAERVAGKGQLPQAHDVLERVLLQVGDRVK